MRIKDLPQTAFALVDTPEDEVENSFIKSEVLNRYGEPLLIYPQRREAEDRRQNYRATYLEIIEVEIGIPNDSKRAEFEEAARRCAEFVRDPECAERGDGEWEAARTVLEYLNLKETKK